MSRLPGGQIRDDLRGTWKDGAVPPNLEGLLEDEEALPGRVSDLIFDYWQVAIAPHWQRIHSVLDDDVAYRGAKAFTNGIFSIFTDLHPEITLVRQGPEDRANQRTRLTSSTAEVSLSENKEPRMTTST
jgi:hypothetical protein